MKEEGKRAKIKQKWRKDGRRETNRGKMVTGSDQEMKEVGKDCWEFKEEMGEEKGGKRETKGRKMETGTDQEIKEVRKEGHEFREGRRDGKRKERKLKKA